MTIAFVITLIAFLVACFLCYAGYVMLNSEVEVLAVRSDQNQRAAARYQELAEQAEKERQQLADELSEAKHREQNYIRARGSANAQFDKQAAMLREAITNLEREQQLRLKAEHELHNYREQVNAAIDRLRGKAA